MASKTPDLGPAPRLVEDFSTTPSAQKPVGIAHGREWSIADIPPISWILALIDFLFGSCISPKTLDDTPSQSRSYSTKAAPPSTPKTTAVARKTTAVASRTSAVTASASPAQPTSSSKKKETAKKPQPTTPTEKPYTQRTEYISPSDASNDIRNGKATVAQVVPRLNQYFAKMDPSSPNLKQIKSWKTWVEVQKKQDSSATNLRALRPLESTLATFRIY